jgi:tRNA threonylcarbamoyladenosine biosynthesis protein TsaB
MSLILNIDTSGETAHVCFSKEGKLLQYLSNHLQKDHASFLHIAIRQLAEISGIKLQDIDAIAVVAGPGSYTGIRVGMASAKGLCYALRKPLVTLNSLEVLTTSAILSAMPDTNTVLLCPMIDARRMEVFTAIYDKYLNPYLSPCPLILNETSFENELSRNTILFFGSGAAKWKTVCRHSNALFPQSPFSPDALCRLSNDMYQKNQFATLAYSDPFYLKEFQTLT